jgi:NAD(P)H dehydrogenase (quinone)
VKTIAVTGVTGQLGSLVAADLAARGIGLRLIARNPARVKPIDGAVVAAAEYGDAAAFGAAVAGADALFLVSATESETRVADHITAVDAAIAAGVGRIVYISFQGAAPDATFTFARDHWHTEQHIASSGIGYTFLRDNNYLAHVPGLVNPTDGVIRGPAGTGRFAPVAHADIAAVAAAVLADDALLVGETRDLTGPDAFTLDEAGQLLTERTGRAISYVQETREEAFASRAHYGAPQWAVEGWVSSYEAIATGELATVSDTVESVLGRPPVSLTQYLKDNPSSLAGLYGYSSVADVAIENPGRWRKQLGSHLGHKIEVRSDDTSSTFDFDGGFGTVSDTAAGLQLNAEAATADTLATIKDVLGRHLERFAQKLDITVTWT